MFTTGQFFGYISSLDILAIFKNLSAAQVIFLVLSRFSQSLYICRIKHQIAVSKLSS